MPAPPQPVSAVADVVGLVQGREVHAEAQLRLDADALTLAWHQAMPWVLAFDGLDGVRIGEREGTLYLEGHDLLELRGDEALRPFLRALQDQVCQVPELLRSVRHFGAIQDSPRIQSAHDGWFAPVLTARRALAGVSDPLRQVALCDAEVLAAGIRRACELIAVQEAPTEAAVQRALTAHLEEAAQEALTATASMALTADALRRGDSETRFADWRRWTASVRDVVRALETGWIAVDRRLR